MSLMFGVTAAADVGSVTPPPSGSQAYDLSAQYLHLGDYKYTGFSRGDDNFGSLQPDVPIKGAVVEGILNIDAAGVFTFNVIISGPQPQDFFDKISLTGVFVDAVSRTEEYLTAAATYTVIDGVRTQWTWSITGSDFMAESNLYSAVFDWTTP